MAWPDSEGKHCTCIGNWIELCIEIEFLFWDMWKLLIFPNFPSAGNLNTIFNTIFITISNLIFPFGIGPQYKDVKAGIHKEKVKADACHAFQFLHYLPLFPPQYGTLYKLRFG